MIKVLTNATGVIILQYINKCIKPTHFTFQIYTILYVNYISIKIL